MVKGAFLAKYVNAANNPVFLAEEELFQQMKLAPGQPLEEFHSLLLEKGSRLGKSSRDITQVKFIAGLSHAATQFLRPGTRDRETRNKVTK